MPTARSYGGRFYGSLTIDTPTIVAGSSVVGFEIYTNIVVQYPTYPYIAINAGPITPVLNPPTQITQRFESNWHYAWSEPVRFKITPRHQAVLRVASGPFAPILNPNTQIIQNFESRWHQPWSEPIRLNLRKGLRAHLQQFFIYHPRELPHANIIVTLSALDPPVTDTTAMFVDATETPPFIDKTAVNVSIEEVPAQSGGNLTLTENEG